MTENQRLGLIAYFRGFIVMMDKCATGANIHACANVKQSLLMMIQMLEHPTKYKSLDYQTARDMVGSSVKKAKEIYREWERLHPKMENTYGTY
jgi:hypothetical protein